MMNSRKDMFSGGTQFSRAMNEYSMLSSASNDMAGKKGERVEGAFDLL